jgi:hypothetical protein
VKQCYKCKETKPTILFSKSKQTKDGFYSWCRVCNNSNRNKFIKTKRGHINQILGNIKYRVKKKQIAFDLDLDYLESIAFDKCPVFQTVFDWGLDKKGYTKERPSLDRIVPELGYVKGNVVFISNWANSIKQDATEKELYTVADWLHDARKKVLNVKKKSDARIPTTDGGESQDNTTPRTVHGSRTR